MKRCSEMLRELSLTQLQTIALFDWGFAWAELIDQIITEKEAVNA